MKTIGMAKHLAWFLCGAVTFGCASVVLSQSAQNKVKRLVMRLGEERFIDDGVKLRLTKGDDDTIVVTISKTSGIGDAAGITDLQTAPSMVLGTYVCEATETTVSGQIGRGLQERGLLTIKLDSIDEDRIVTATLTRRRGSTGTLRGRLEVNGDLQLSGRITDRTIVGYWNVDLKARIVRGRLSNGTYKLSSTTEVEGTFDRAELQRQ